MLLSDHDYVRLDRALSCPFDASKSEFPLGARNLIYNCWAAVLCEHLPDPSIVSLLVDGTSDTQRSIWFEDNDIDISMRIPTNATDLELLDASEFDSVVKVLETSRTDLLASRLDGPTARVREDIGADSISGSNLHTPSSARPECGTWLDKEFDKLTSWVQLLRLVPSGQRAKHWPPPNIKTEEELLEYSARNPNQGWLNININEQHLRDTCLAGVAHYFDDALMDKIPTYFWSENSREYLALWADLFRNSNFRLGIRHPVKIGAAQGQMVNKMVYDISKSGKEFHCFPVQEFPDGMTNFLEGQLDT